MFYCDLGLYSLRSCEVLKPQGLGLDFSDSLKFDSLICTMGIPILVRQHLYIESGPWIYVPLAIFWVIVFVFFLRTTWLPRTLLSKLSSFQDKYSIHPTINLLSAKC